MGIRVTTPSYSSQYTTVVQELKNAYNKSSLQVSSGKKFDYAKDDPSDYYEGQKLSTLYSEASSKESLIDDVINRLEQQESAARSVSSVMTSINTDLLKIQNASNDSLKSTVDTVYNELLEYQSSMVYDMNAQYENYYCMGGNDYSTLPFNISEDGQTLTYNHLFTGDDDVTHIQLQYDYSSDSFTASLVDSSGNALTKSDGSSYSESDAMDKLLQAMREQGKMSLGTGSLEDRSSLTETYYGGLNMITGLTSDSLRSMDDQEAESLIKERLLESPIGLNAKAISSVGNYNSSFTSSEDASGSLRSRMNEDISYCIDKWDSSYSRVTDTYRRIGITVSSLESTQTRLQSQMDDYEEQYSSHMGIDEAEAITNMYSDQYAYSAALQVGSQILQNSLFNYID